MVSGDKVYLKFSYPKKDFNKALFLQIENVWGDFKVYLDRSEKFPSKDKNAKTFTFVSQKAGLL
jgi:hypothetical protein